MNYEKIDWIIKDNLKVQMLNILNTNHIKMHNLNFPFPDFL